MSIYLLWLIWLTVSESIIRQNMVPAASCCIAADIWPLKAAAYIAWSA